MKTIRQASRGKTRRKHHRNGFQLSPLLQNLLHRVNSFKFKIIPLSLMLGLSMTAVPAQARHAFQIDAGTVYNNPAGTVLQSNYGVNAPNYPLYSVYWLSNSGTLNNSGTLYNDFGNLNNYSGSKLNNSGLLKNYSFRGSVLSNYSGATLNNSGTLGRLSW